jgi:peptide-methionine (S)-S-oxide reductase
MLRLASVAIAAAALLGIATARADDTPAPRDGIGVATFGSGCFWCTESDFDKLPGVLTTVSGYMGGLTPRPTYEEVGRGRTGHAEVLQVTYDTRTISYAQLLDYFWRTTDVTDGGGQFCDRGNQYRPVIFTHDAEQERLARDGKAALDASGRLGKPVAVQIAPKAVFTRAEEYHQDFYKKDPTRYYSYRRGCGRDARLDMLWGKDRLAGFEIKAH